MQGVESGDKLSPCSLAYTSDAFQIPIRIGTLNAKEAQDLVVYAVSDYSNGRVGIANSVYREFSIEDECMWDPVDGQSFGEYYAEHSPMDTRKRKMVDGPLNMPGVVAAVTLFWNAARCF